MQTIEACHNSCFLARVLLGLTKTAQKRSAGKLLLLDSAACLTTLAGSVQRLENIKSASVSEFIMPEATVRIPIGEPANPVPGNYNPMIWISRGCAPNRQQSP